MYVVYLAGIAFIAFLLFFFSLHAFSTSFRGGVPVFEELSWFLIGGISLHMFLFLSLPISVRYMGFVWKLIRYEPPVTKAHFVVTLLGAAVAVYMFLRKR